MEVDRYLDLFDKVKTRVGSDEVAAVIIDQLGKDSRVQVMQGVTGGFDQPRDTKVIHGDEPATEKQLAYLKRLGVSFSDDITRLEASQMIDSAKA